MTNSIGCFHYNTFSIDGYKSSEGIVIYIYDHSNQPNLIQKLIGKEEDLIELILLAKDIIWEQIEEELSMKEKIT